MHTIFIHVNINQFKKITEKYNIKTSYRSPNMPFEVGGPGGMPSSAYVYSQWRIIDAALGLWRS